MVDALFSTGAYVTAKKMLDVTALRHEALASNIANIETPGYKRLDVSVNFDNELRTASDKGDLSAIRRLSPSITEDMAAGTTRADGNNVSMDRELMADSANTVQYSFLTQYLSSSLKRLESALKGQGN